MSDSQEGFRTFPAIIFLAFSAGITTLTHVPLPAMGTPVFSWQDKVAHALIYFLWTILLLRAIPPTWAAGRKALVIAAISGVVYAAIDEATQGIPGLQRSPDLFDFLADSFGVFGGVLIGGRFPRILGRQRISEESPIDRGKIP